MIHYLPIIFKRFTTLSTLKRPIIEMDSCVILQTHFGRIAFRTDRTFVLAFIRMGYGMKLQIIPKKIVIK